MTVLALCHQSPDFTAENAEDAEKTCLGEEKIKSLHTEGHRWPSPAVPQGATEKTNNQGESVQSVLD